MGLLVYENTATVDLIIDLVGGIVTTMSRKLQVWKINARGPTATVRGRVGRMAG